MAKASLLKLLPVVSNSDVLWVNSAKTYVDKAELMIAQSLRVNAVVRCGMSQALTLHDMKKQFVFIGIVENNPHEAGKLKAGTINDLAAKLINVLEVDLKPKAIPHESH